MTAIDEGEWCSNVISVSSSLERWWEDTLDQMLFITMLTGIIDLYLPG